ncbi:hypothetical protein BaRGS_00007591 [Batillaria attramentaria]|uniref:Uncharacterized protein n=1 Tax=Batillaria attramentaria TaxID=370345 RepID=A0ABD0LPK8_9CAEN
MGPSNGINIVSGTTDKLLHELAEPVARSHGNSSAEDTTTVTMVRLDFRPHGDLQKHGPRLEFLMPTTIYPQHLREYHQNCQYRLVSPATSGVSSLPLRVHSSVCRE